MLLGLQGLPQQEARHSLVPCPACASWRLVPSARRLVGAPLDPSGMLGLVMATRRKQECRGLLSARPLHTWLVSPRMAIRPVHRAQDCASMNRELEKKTASRCVASKRFTAHCAPSGLPLSWSKRPTAQYSPKRLTAQSFEAVYRSVAQSGLPLSIVPNGLPLSIFQAVYRSVFQSGLPLGLSKRL